MLYYSKAFSQIPGIHKTMKIVMCSINPLFVDKVIGGSTKHLRRVAEHLAGLGHQVVILCTRRDASQDDIRWHSNIKVRAVFKFKQPFPLPYDIPAYEMTHIIQQILDECADADRLYLHDGEILFPHLSPPANGGFAARLCLSGDDAGQLPVSGRCHYYA